jgi:adenylate kinase family enzyme
MGDIKFFLGTGNANGYVSYFHDTYNPENGGKYFILKGGPGSGKSSFMKKSADEIEKEGFTVHKIHCSSDPYSLDAVLFPELNAGIFDGTAPHIMEPVLPGVCDEIVNLGDCWDSRILRQNRAALTSLKSEYKEFHKKSSDFLFVASRFDKENLRIVSRTIDGDKLERYITRLCTREISISKNRNGKLHKRFLSAVTPENVVVFTDTVVELSTKIIVVHDEFSAVSPLITVNLCAYALKNGLDVIACYCPLFPKEKIEHLFIPELSLAVFSSNSYHKAPKEFGKQVHAARFLDKETINLKKEFIDFNKKAKSELILEAVTKLKQAKAVHDKMEEYYVKAMDFDKLEHMRQKVVSKIFDFE